MPAQRCWAESRARVDEHAPGPRVRHALGRGARFAVGVGHRHAGRAIGDLLVGVWQCLGKRRDNALVEVRSGVAPQFDHRFGGGHRGPVGTSARHRIERVGDADDAGADGDVVALEAIGVAQAVWSFVVQFDDGQIGRQERQRLQDPRPVVGVRLHVLVLLGGQRAHLAEHRVAHADLADVVEQCAEAQDVEVFARKRHRLADGDGNAAHAFGVPRGVLVARVERGRERFDDADIRAARVRLGRAQRPDQRVERVGQRIDLAALPRPRHDHIEPALAGDVRNRS